MNFSIYLRLLRMNHHNEIKIKEKYKYREFMLSNNWMEPTQSHAGPESSPDSPLIFSTTITGDYFKITGSGRSALFDFRWRLLPIAVSTLALIVSFLAYLKK